MIFIEHGFIPKETETFPKKKEIKKDFDVQSGPAFLAEERPKRLDFESLKNENEQLSSASRQLQKEANGLFSQLQKKYGRQKWDKNDPLYQEWRLTVGQVMQLEKISEINNGLLQKGGGIESLADKLHFQSPSLQKMKELSVEKQRGNWETAAGAALIQKELFREGLENTELEKRIVSFFRQAKDMVKDFLSAKKGTSEETAAEEKLIGFIRETDEKTLWQITGKMAGGTILEDDVRREKGIFGLLKNFFQKKSGAEKDYQTWIKFVDEYRPIVGNVASPRASRGDVREDPPIKFKSL